MRSLRPPLARSYAVACGVAAVERSGTAYTLSIASAVAPGAAVSQGAGSAASAECQRSFGLELSSTVPRSTGPFSARRCQRCPQLLPATRYVLLLVAEGGRLSELRSLAFATASSG